jgi:hypothetical protein
MPPMRLPLMHASNDASQRLIQGSFQNGDRDGVVAVRSFCTFSGRGFGLSIGGTFC